jgi:hypothetical protein
VSGSPFLMQLYKNICFTDADWFGCCQSNGSMLNLKVKIILSLKKIINQLTIVLYSFFKINHFKAYMITCINNQLNIFIERKSNFKCSSAMCGLSW